MFDEMSYCHYFVLVFDDAVAVTFAILTVATAIVNLLIGIVKS